MEVIINRRRRQATVSYEWVDYSESLYRAPEPCPKHIRISHTEVCVDENGEEYEEEIELHSEDLSRRQQKLVERACSRDAREET